LKEERKLLSPQGLGSSSPLPGSVFYDMIYIPLVLKERTPWLREVDGSAITQRMGIEQKLNTLLNYTLTYTLTYIFYYKKTGK
jgi:hypothetical protein